MKRLLVSLERWTERIGESRGRAEVRPYDELCELRLLALRRLTGVMQDEINSAFGRRACPRYGTLRSLQTLPITDYVRV